MIEARRLIWCRCKLGKKVDLVSLQVSDLVREYFPSLAPGRYNPESLTRNRVLVIARPRLDSISQ